MARGGSSQRKQDILLLAQRIAALRLVQKAIPALRSQRLDQISARLAAAVRRVKRVKSQIAGVAIVVAMVLWLWARIGW